MSDARTRHALDLHHYAKASNGSSIPSNWIPATPGDNSIIWRPESAGGSVSYASNSNDVGNANAAGASSLVSRADHVHRGVRTITSNGSNGLFGDVNLSAGSGIALGVVGQSISIVNTGSTGGGGGSGTSPFYDVTDPAYGAVGDGTTDDTAAIVAAFDAADVTGGGIIYFPPSANYYKITSLITRTGTSKYHLLGGGTRYAPARVHQATANTGAFKFAPGSGTANRDKAPLIQSLVITGAGGASSGRGVEAQNDLHMRDCFVSGFYDGVYLSTASYYSAIVTSTFTDCDNSAISLIGTNNTLIDGCRITGQWGAGSGLFNTLKTGIYISCSSPTGINNRIVNCSIEYFTDDGVYWDGGYACELVGTYFESQQSGSGKAHVRLGPANTMYSTRIDSNYFQGDSGAPQYAISFDHVNGAVVSNNKFGINAAIGTLATGNTSNILLWDNHNSPAGTFSLPATSYTLDPANPPATVGTPALSFGTANSAGTATDAVRTDATLAIFDATVPVTQAFGDSAATGSAAFAARRDHKHGMPATPTTGSGGQILVSDTPAGSPLVFSDLLQNEAGTDLIYADS